MSRCNLARFGDEADPQVVLKLVIKEAHFGVGILGVVFHGHIVDSLSSIAQAARHSEDLFARPLSVFLLLLLRHRLV